MDFDLKSISAGFVLDGDFVSAERFGTGHINDTFKLATTREAYILQRINTNVFKAPEALMENFVQVCSHIAGKIEAEKQRRAEARRRQANTTGDISEVIDIENDSPISLPEEHEEP